ncbi:MAG: hypothetical protein HYW48_07180 [Deltaproteobacteria bacterium]|nr:hypothetical protein [Deltaproteobacteria bacterium]
MQNDYRFLDELTQNFRDIHVKRNILLTFPDFLDLLATNPRKFIRSSTKYILDTFDFFGSMTVDNLYPAKIERFKLFDIGTERSGPIIGGEQFQDELYYILKNFERSGFNSHLTLFHGPNGSAKSSTVETIANGMERYSKTDEGAIYRFNWVFPNDRDATPSVTGDSQAIGFQKRGATQFGKSSSFALLEERKISAKLSSEFRENPLFLIPPPYREELLRQWIAERENIPPQEVTLPPHILGNGLTKKNQEVFENLLNSYKGDLSQVFRHVQVERFFFSKQYRVGISAVEPQMSIDAMEKQLTIDKNYTNLPSVLQTISFHQTNGPLVESNRGLLEFSDLLKRPVETFKYLLSTIEKGTINLPSGTAALDIVFVGTTNDKHLDAFKSVPDFSSFKGRIELVTVPYLLVPEKEEKIFASDVKTLTKIKPLAPHSVRLLCTWGVLTRLKQPDPEKYPLKYRSLVGRLDPLSKLRLFQKLPLQPAFSQDEQKMLLEIREKIITESQRTLIYEGRFGASPRELRGVLRKAGQNPRFSDLTPMAVFEEIENLIKDRTVYEFLQFEPRARYHDVTFFVEKLKEEFAYTFEHEVIQSMSMVGEDEYSHLFERYISHVVAHVKNEKIWDESSHSNVLPSLKIMSDVEKILGVKGPTEEHRNALLSRIAAFKIENPKEDINVSELFREYLHAVKEHFYNEKRKVIESNITAMIAFHRDELRDEKSKILAETTYKNMNARFGYSASATYDCLRFALQQKKQVSNGSGTSSDVLHAQRPYS